MRGSDVISSVRLGNGQHVAVRTPAPRDIWRELFESDPDAMPSQAPEWIDCLRAEGHEDASRLYETADGQRMVMPLVRRLHRPAGLSILGSMPAHWGYGGLIAPGGVTPELVSTVLDDLAATPALRIHLSPNPLHAAVWAQAAANRRGLITVPCCSYILDLEGGFERVWRDRFRSTTRSQVRLAERSGVVVETDTSGRLVQVFHDLLQLSFDRWAQQQHEPRILARYRGRRRDPLHKLQRIAERLGERCRVSVAWYEGRPAAAIVVLRDGANAHYLHGAMDKPLAARSHANNLLHKRAIEDACLDGCRTYHMGAGDWANLARFKSRFGAKPYPYAEYWLERVPVTRVDRALRSGAKRLIGFQDA